MLCRKLDQEYSTFLRSWRDAARRVPVFKEIWVHLGYALGRWRGAAFYGTTYTKEIHLYI